MLAVYKVRQCITPEVKDKAQAKLHQWFGEYDGKEIVLNADEYEIKQTDHE